MEVAVHEPRHYDAILVCVGYSQTGMLSDCFLKVSYVQYLAVADRYESVGIEIIAILLVVEERIGLERKHLPRIPFIVGTSSFPLWICFFLEVTSFSIQVQQSVFVQCFAAFMIRVLSKVFYEKLA